MMRWIVQSSLKSGRVVVAAAVVVMAFGVWQMRTSKVDALPEFGPPTVEVQTEALGLSSEEVEQLITIPLEQDLLDGVAWLDKISSKSVPGLSSVQLVFEPGTDLYRARQVVQERISQAAGLPNVSRPPQMLQPQSATSRTAMVTLSSKDLTPIRIGVLARWTIRPRLLAIPGVANVAIWGQRERQLQVQVDPKKLKDRNVSLERVISSTGNALYVSPLTFLEASTPGTGGFIDTPNQRLGIQHNLPIIGPQDLAQIPIDDATPEEPLVLGDVATVVEDHQPLIGDAVVDGDSGDGGFLMVVEKLPGANTTEVAKGVDDALQALRPALTGLQMDSTAFRPAAYVDRSLGNVLRSLLVGAVLVAVALALLLLDWRAALTASVAIGLSTVVAGLVLHLFHTTFNLVVIAGLLMALGAVVHDAVSGGEALARRRRAQTDPDEAPVHTVLAAALDNGRTAVWATVVLVLAISPIFFMQGLSGDSFFPPLAIAGLAAVGAAMLVTVTVTPALQLLLWRHGPIGEAPPARGSVRATYERVVGPAIRTPVPALAAIALVLVGAALAAPRVDKALLPTLRDTNLVVHWTGASGTSLGEMNRITGRASAELKTLPGVDKVATQVGQALLGDQAVGSDSAEMWVRLDPEADYDATVASVRRVVDGYPGLGHRVATYSKDKLGEVLAQADHEVTVRVFGNDLGVLHQKADEVKNLLSGIDGVTAEHVAARGGEPTMEVQVDLAKARQAGIKPGDVRRAAATLLSGIRVGNLFQDQKVFDVQIWSTPETRHSFSNVEDLLIDTPSGTPVRMGDVAAVTVRPTDPVIRHEDISRYVDVTADVRGRSVGKVNADIHERLGSVAFPSEYHAQLLGDYADQSASQHRLLLIAAAAAIGVLLLLQASSGSWRLAFLSYLLLPVAVAGGALAAVIRGGPWTLATIAGLLALLALSLRGSIQLLGRFARLRTSEGLPFGPELVRRGAREHARPTVVTALTSAVVLLPVLVIGDAAGLEVLHPMAVVILGGLVTWTVVNLVLLPSLYLAFGPRQEPPALVLEDELDMAEPRLATAGVGAD